MGDLDLAALIFDVDGTLAETEELHREAFNRAFAGEGAGEIADPFVTGGKGEFGVGPRGGATGTGLGGGNFSLVEGEFGVTGRHFGDERVEFDRRVGSPRRSGADECD